MNPLVSNDVETRLLEDLFEHEVKCEGVLHETMPCSVQITHFFRSCAVGKLVCTVFAVETIQEIEQGYICGDCKNSVSECWTIRPI